ncbi:MFS transporter [Actinomadura sp. DC4]|uniref:MFS transporter n=1 Tax=Actinomadura sp. DC4 TaxID=3055069 RepID=UPI0025B1D072|nr:MFS transporter [Actinomadura sp. DC4]MDN3351504.1 MFS transporter [Actinomadura sp. DC4]
MRWSLIVLLCANAVSLTGNVLSMLAVPWFVLQTTGSPARTGLAAFASTLPVVISATFAGTLIDRLGLRRASVLSDLFSGVIVLAIPLLYLTYGLSYGLLLVLLFARWLLATPGETARETLIPELAARARFTMERATAAYDGAYRGAKMVGAPLAGVLIVWLGPTNLLLIDGMTFLLSAVMIRFGVPGSSPKTVEHTGYVDSLREGMAFLWHDRLLRSAVAMVLVTNLLDTGLGQVLLPLYARDVTGDPRAFGLLVGAVGAGAVVGTVAYGTLGARLPRRMTFALCFLVAGLPRTLILATDVTLDVALAVTVVSGFAAGAINPLLGVVEFERIPVRLRARVLGTITAGAYAGMPFGGLLAGGLTELAGLATTLVVFAGVYLLASIPPFIGRAWREPGLTPRKPRTDRPA